MIKHWDVIMDTNLISLGLRVNDQIRQGWQPFGSLVRADGEAGFVVYQAMVKYAA